MDLGIGGDGELASAAHGVEESAFGGHTELGFAMVQPGADLGKAKVVFPNLLDPIIIFICIVITFQGYCLFIREYTTGFETCQKVSILIETFQRKFRLFLKYIIKLISDGYYS